MDHSPPAQNIGAALLLEILSGMGSEMSVFHDLATISSKDSNATAQAHSNPPSRLGYMAGLSNPERTAGRSSSCCSCLHQSLATLGTSAPQNWGILILHSALTHLAFPTRPTQPAETDPLAHLPLGS